MKKLHTSLAAKARCVKNLPFTSYLNCTKTNFSDFHLIQVTSNHNKSGEIIVTEIDVNGTKNIYTHDASSMKTMEIELSDWYGYGRRLFNDGSSWTIEHRDECSGGYGSAVCE